MQQEFSFQKKNSNEIQLIEQNVAHTEASIKLAVNGIFQELEKSNDTLNSCPRNMRAGK
jgi:hypothetical protein